MRCRPVVYITHVKRGKIMRNCSELKRLNSDKKFRSELNKILNLCRQNGHRPVRGTDMFRRLTSIEHAMYIRTIKNIPVPSDIMTLISDIKALPSLAEKQQSEVIKQADVEQKFFDAQYQKIVKIFPHVNLLRVAYGDEFYKSFINAKFDAIAVKVIADYVNEVVNGFIFSSEPYDIININTVCKSVGIGVSDKDIQSIQDDYRKNNITNRPVPSKDGLNSFELAVLYGIGAPAARERVVKMQRKLKWCFYNIDNVLRMYVAGDVDGIMRTLSPQQYRIYKFQNAKNILDISSDDLLVLGKIFTNTGSELLTPEEYTKSLQKSDKTIDVYNNNYAKIKQIFPKVDLLREFLGDKQFRFFIEKPIDSFAIKIMSDYTEYKIKNIYAYGGVLARNMDIYLKYNGFGITDYDITKIQLCKRMNFIDTPTNKDKLSVDDLACLYDRKPLTITRVINSMMRRLHGGSYQLSMYDMFRIYMYRDVSEMIDNLPTDLKKIYNFQQKYNMQEMPTCELLKAGAVLRTLYSKNQKQH